MPSRNLSALVRASLEWYYQNNTDMPPANMADLMQQERTFLEKIRKEHPGSLDRDEPPAQDAAFPYIGIEGLPENRPDAYLRLYPQDFLVEEVTQTQQVVKIANASEFVNNDDKRTLWADLIKAHIAGFDAVKELSTALDIPQEMIGYAGIKDKIAITSQRLSLRGVTLEQAKALRHPRLVLRPISYGNGALQPGHLYGNQFTLTLRTNESCDEALIKQRLSQPFWNFFGPQRFGSRVLSHRLGQALLQGDTNTCLKLFFTQPGLNDVPFFHALRNELAENYGDWRAMDDICAILPLSFSHERQVLAALIEHPHKTRAALNTIKDQVKMWVHAYGSWLMNRELSRLLKNRDPNPPKTIPLPFSSQGALATYAETMKKEGTLGYREAFAQYPYLSLNDKSIPTRIQPQNVRVKVFSQGCIARFCLDKGAYATTCLSHAFRVVEGLPVPSWVQDGLIDGFAELGETPLTSLLSQFEADATARRDAFLNEDGTEE